MPLSGPMKTATVIARFTPDERRRLEQVARDRNVTLSEALREGLKLLAQDELAKVKPRERVAGL